MINFRPLLIINNFNGGKYLSEAICSSIAQTAKRMPDMNYHVLGIDAGSTDNSIGIYRGFGTQDIKKALPEDPPGTLFLIELPGMGQAQAINEAIKTARSRCNYTHFSWCNNDDLLLPRFIESHIEAFRFNPLLRMVYSRAIIFTDHNSFKNDPYIDIEKVFAWGQPMEGTLMGGGHNFVPQNSVMLDIRLFDEIGYFDESFRYAFDFHFWARLLHRGIINTILPEYTCLYRQRDDNLTYTRTAEIYKEIDRVRDMFTRGEM